MEGRMLRAAAALATSYGLQHSPQQQARIMEQLPQDPSCPFSFQAGRPHTAPQVQAVVPVFLAPGGALTTANVPLPTQHTPSGLVVPSGLSGGLPLTPMAVERTLPGLYNESSLKPPRTCEDWMRQCFQDQWPGQVPSGTTEFDAGPSLDVSAGSVSEVARMQNLVSRPVEQWDEDDVTRYVSTLSAAPDGLYEAVRAHAISGLVLLSLTDQDIDNLDIKKFGVRRILRLAAHQLQKAIDVNITSLARQEPIRSAPARRVIAAAEVSPSHRAVTSRSVTPVNASPSAPVVRAAATPREQVVDGALPPPIGSTPDLRRVTEVRRMPVQEAATIASMPSPLTVYREQLPPANGGQCIREPVAQQNGSISMPTTQPAAKVQRSQSAQIVTNSPQLGVRVVRPTPARQVSAVQMSSGMPMPQTVAAVTPQVLIATASGLDETRHTPSRQALVTDSPALAPRATDILGTSGGASVRRAATRSAAVRQETVVTEHRSTSAVCRSQVQPVQLHRETIVGNNVVADTPVGSATSSPCLLRR
mmetsp:Transcript_48145/g.114439  ORF Transcript_48145/g.114439 Transcript_48145/m.114439 type:complete len:533 (-) Transcript_48145:107-1705(-)